MSDVREGDIESLTRKMKDEGRPIKSDIIRDGSKQIFYRREGAKVRITEVLDQDQPGN